MTLPPRSSGPPLGAAAPELVDSGFALENADAPYLHAGFNLADIAHLLDLHRRWGGRGGGLSSFAGALCLTKGARPPPQPSPKGGGRR